MGYLSNYNRGILPIKGRSYVFGEVIDEEKLSAEEIKSLNKRGLIRKMTKKDEDELAEVAKAEAKKKAKAEKEAKARADANAQVKKEIEAEAKKKAKTDAKEAPK